MHIGVLNVNIVFKRPSGYNPHVESFNYVVTENAVHPDGFKDRMLSSNNLPSLELLFYAALNTFIKRRNPSRDQLRSTSISRSFAHGLPDHTDDRHENAAANTAASNAAYDTADICASRCLGKSQESEHLSTKTAAKDTDNRVTYSSQR